MINWEYTGDKARLTRLTRLMRLTRLTRLMTAGGTQVGRTKNT